MEDTKLKQESGKIVKAFARDLRIAPRKLRLVSNMVKGMRVSDALVQLAHTNKKGADIVVKLLKSATANAQNNFSLDPDALFIKSITTDMGRVMKRYFPRARGSAFVIRRKMAHLNVLLEEKAGAKKKSRFKIPAKAKLENVTDEVKVAPEVEQGSITEKTLPKKERIKTSEQVKSNTVGQKRRLFNRKSGE